MSNPTRQCHTPIGGGWCISVCWDISEMSRGGLGRQSATNSAPLEPLTAKDSPATSWCRRTPHAPIELGVVIPKTPLKEVHERGHWYTTAVTTPRECDRHATCDGSKMVSKRLTDLKEINRSRQRTEVSTGKKDHRHKTKIS